MTTPQTEVSEHYTIVELGDQILDALEAAGKDFEALTVYDLAPVDEFHMGGRAATATQASATSTPNAWRSASGGTASPIASGAVVR